MTAIDVFVPRNYRSNLVYFNILGTKVTGFSEETGSSTATVLGSTTELGETTVSGANTISEESTSVSGGSTVSDIFDTDTTTEDEDVSIESSKLI